MPMMVKVKDLMSSRVYTIGAEEYLDRAIVLFHFEAIRHLPVLENGHLVGVISDRDVKKVLGPRQAQVTKGADGSSIAVPGRKVRTVMSRKLVTVGPDEKAADAAAIMAKRKIGCLPVVKNGSLVGIITATDILRAFVKLAEAHQKLLNEQETGTGEKRKST